MRRRLHKQERANTCAVAALRTVLDLQFGVRVAEQALEILGTDPHEPIQKRGTDTHQLRSMVRGASRALNAGKPWTLRARRHGTLEDLDTVLSDGRFPLVRVHEQSDAADYHMIVVLRVEGHRVQYFDPAPSSPKRPVWMDALSFLAWWGGDGVTTWYAVLGGGDGGTRVLSRDRRGTDPGVRAAAGLGPGGLPGRVDDPGHVP